MGTKKTPQQQSEREDCPTTRPSLPLPGGYLRLAEEDQIRGHAAAGRLKMQFCSHGAKTRETSAQLGAPVADRIPGLPNVRMSAGYDASLTL
jgi:hypothetical protein